MKLAGVDSISPLLLFEISAGTDATLAFNSCPTIMNIFYRCCFGNLCQTFAGYPAVFSDSYSEYLKLQQLETASHLQA
jgi:hypothetical protein